MIYHQNQTVSRPIFRAAYCILSLLFFQGCQSKFDPDVRRTVFNRLLQEKDLQAQIIQTANFPLMSAFRKGHGSQAIVYIEGDGLGWLTPYTISPDPTPTFPVTLDIVSEMPTYTQIYLARLCQYVTHKHCHKSLWTSAVYGKSQLEALSYAMDQYKNQLAIHSFTIVGYSGGGVLALLLAGHRSDVKKVVTVASNIDVDEWTRTEGISSLQHSLKPKDNMSKLCGKTYTFIWGAQDRVVPYGPQLPFAHDLAKCAHVHTVIVPGLKHDSSWRSVVKNYLREF